MSSNKVLGMHRITNKVRRNAFDLSHRHMFTAQVGELLPVFVQWVNPNETFKLGYNGKTRTASLNTDAFTRIRENIQYYFVPFQALWKYFEQSVNNMKVGDAGQSISRFAQSSVDSEKISTSMPYVNYLTLLSWLGDLFSFALTALDNYFKAFTTVDKRSAAGFFDYCSDNNYHVFNCDGYRYARAAKLLTALGYGNFKDIQTYDLYAMAENYVSLGHSWDRSVFASKYSHCLQLASSTFSSVKNAPNLSLFPLLAYHKIVNDHYRNEKWQSFEAWTCNIDYVSPSSSHNASDFITTTGSQFAKAITNIIDLENSNLPIDYFTAVLPRAQYGDESAATIDGSSKLSFDGGKITLSDPTLRLSSGTAASGTSVTTGSYASANTDAQINVGSQKVGNIKGSLFSDSLKASVDSSLKISALRSAIALQKYKEVQNSNDPDFSSQVLAHFGIKPKTDARTSVFIGGDDKTLSINPQVNTNLTADAEPTIKAIGVGDLSASCKFTSSTYGIIMGIYRAVPQLDYANVGINRQLFKTDASDFPIPELDSIGMQTQYRVELSAPSVGQFGYDYYLRPENADMSMTYGYAPRYAELKSAHDYYEGGFFGAYSSWVTGYDSTFLRDWRLNHSTSSISYDGIDKLFKCRPSLLYPIFVNQWSGTVNDDKLLIGSVNSCVAVRPFSVYGLPYTK